MKYTTDSAMKEILIRSRRLKEERKHRQQRVVSVVAVVCFAALMLIFIIFPGQALKSQDGSSYGSLLLFQNAGGYVLAAIIAFVLGITVTMLCLHWRNKKGTDNYDIYSEDQVSGLNDEALAGAAGGADQHEKETKEITKS